MKRYIIWCRFTGLAVNREDEQWNVELPKRDLWGFATREEAEKRAEQWRNNWREGYMETYVAEVTLPD
jgi:hypothetical protein